MKPANLSSVIEDWLIEVGYLPPPLNAEGTMTKADTEVVEQAVRELQREGSPTADELREVWDRLLAEAEARGEDEPDITIGTKPWTDEQVAEMTAIAKRADLRHARELLESSGFVVSEALPKPAEAQD